MINDTIDNMTDKFDTWLDENDLDRLWKVVQGELPDNAASEDEVSEFLKLVTHAAMIKHGGSGYQSATIH